MQHRGQVDAGISLFEVSVAILGSPSIPFTNQAGPQATELPDYRLVSFLEREVNRSLRLLT